MSANISHTSDMYGLYIGTPIQHVWSIYIQQMTLLNAFVSTFRVKYPNSNNGLNNFTYIRLIDKLKYKLYRHLKKANAIIFNWPNMIGLIR